MKNKILKLISELEVGKQKAEKGREWGLRKDNLLAANQAGMITAFCLCIEKLTLLLSDTSETGDVGQNLGDIEPLIKGESPCAWDW